jgi:hypothetical protein
VLKQTGYRIVSHHPSRPSFGFVEKQELLKCMGRLLELSRLYRAHIDKASSRHQKTDDLRRAILALATDLTADPDYFGHPVSDNEKKY